jgi:hypothetical protein
LRIGQKPRARPAIEIVYVSRLMLTLRRSNHWGTLMDVLRTAPVRSIHESGKFPLNPVDLRTFGSWKEVRATQTSAPLKYISPAEDSSCAAPVETE